MKKLWKIYDFSLPFALAGLIMSLILIFKDRNLGIIALVIIGAALTGKFIYYKRKKEKLLFQIDAVSRELDFDQGKAFQQLTVPCCVIEQDGSFIWFNGSFKEYFDITPESKMKSIGELVNRESIEKLLIGKGFRVRIGNQYFSVYSSEILAVDENVYLLYLNSNPGKILCILAITTVNGVFRILTISIYTKC